MTHLCNGELLDRGQADVCSFFLYLISEMVVGS